MSTTSDQAPEVLPARRHLPWYRRWLPSWRTVAVVVLVLLAGPFSVRTYRLWRMPNVPVPFDMEAFLAEPEFREDDANYFFAGAEPNYDHRGFAPTLFHQQLLNGGTISWDGVPESSRTWAAEQRPALELYRRAAQCPTCIMVPAKHYRFASDTKSVNFHEGMVQVTVIEALRLMHEGDTSSAAELLHDAFRATRHAGNRGGPNGSGLGDMGHYMLSPAWQMWSRHPEVTAEQLAETLNRMQRDWELTPPLSDQLKIEYATLVNEAKPPQARLKDRFFRELNAYCIRKFELAIGPLDRIIPGRLALWSIGEPELSLRAARLRLAHELKTCDLPLAQQPPRFPDGAKLRQTEDVIGGLSSAELNHRLGEAMFTDLSYRRGREFNHYQDALQILLETELRLQQFYRENNCTSRDQVEPLLASFEWPIDPTEPNAGPVRHRSSDAGLVIWCVGPNGIDEQGEAPKRENHGDMVVVIPWPGDVD